MRVITGSAKGRKLLSPPGIKTRPITDRAKQALFSILDDWIVSARVLDLFGGSGAVGIEALSRGATFAQFIDLERKAVETIQTNLRNCKLASSAQVMQGDSFAWLERYDGDPFDFIFVAPPQYHGLWSKALLSIDGRPGLLAEDATVVVQIHPREETPIELGLLEEYDRRKYGSVMLLFYASKTEMEALRARHGEEAHRGDFGHAPQTTGLDAFEDEALASLSDRDLVDYLLSIEDLDRQEFERIAEKVLATRNVDLMDLLTDEELAELEEIYEEMDAEEELSET